MKRNWLRRVLTIGLALVMAVGLCACGDAAGASGDGSGSSGNGGGGKKKDPNAALAKENVYKYQEFDMPEIDGDAYNVRASFHKDGMIYLLLQVYNWSSGGDEDDIRLITMKDDGTQIQMLTLQMPETESPEGAEENTGEEGGETDDGTGGDVSILPMPRAESTETESEDKVVTEDTIIKEPEFSNVWENNSYNNYTFGADGKLYATRNYYYEDYSDPENYISIQKTYVNCWNLDGSHQWEVEVEGLQSEEEWVYLAHMSASVDGTVNLLLTGDNVYKMQLTAEGAGEKKPVAEEIGTIFRNHGAIIPKSDGTLLVTYYNENDWAKMFIASYDPATDTIGEPSQLPSAFSYGGYYAINSGFSSDLIYCANNGIFTYNLGDTDVKQKMNFINSDLNVTNFNSLTELSDTSFVGVFYESYGNEMNMGLFTYVPPEEIPDKSVLVLAGSWLGTDMKQRVVEYNRSNEQYRIVLKEYESYNTYEDYQAGYKQLNNDIITGNMPDIIITQGLPVENYASKGWLADIGKLIAEDEELSQVEFVQNVFDAYSMEGKLYYIIPNFTVATIIGKTSIVGDRSSWTMADMQQLLASLPEGTEMFGELTRGYFFNMVMQYCGSDFVDVETGKCDFNSQNFIEMMEYAKSLPEELGEDYYGEDFWMNYESRYRENRTVLMGMTIGAIQNLNYTLNGTFGEDVSFIGFPTMSGQGSYVNANSSYAISSRSKHIEAAWDFMKYYLTDEYQAEMGWGLPIQKKYLLESAQKATQRPYYLDEEGNKVEYDDYFYMNGEEIKLDPMTQEQVDEIVNFILTVNKSYYNNEEVLNIINEEMGGYFAGQKAAQDVAGIIQSRIQIYVDENR